MGMYRVKNWSADERVEDAQVEPHRYTYADFDDGYRDAPDFREFLAGVPYKEGEVVYVEAFDPKTGRKVAKRAKVADVWFDRDRFGDRREMFRLQLETAKGIWAKVGTKAWAGQIQRGYQLAGLAPDCDEADRRAEEYRAKMKAAERERVNPE